jgi:hypothetical protein
MRSDRLLKAAGEGEMRREGDWGMGRSKEGKIP